MGEPHAGIPLRLTPRRGHRRAPHGCGEAVWLHVQPWHPPDGLTSRVAARALYREAHRAHLARTQRQGSTRVPATWRAAQAAVAHAEPPALGALQAGSRAHELTSTDGGVAPRWVLIDAKARQAPAQRTVDQPWRQPRAQDVNAWKT